MRRLARRGARRATCSSSSPGALEIRRAAEACAELRRAHGLRGPPAPRRSLPPAEQDRAVRPAGAAQGDPLHQRRRDQRHHRRRGGGHRQRASRAWPLHSPWSGLPTLRVRQDLPGPRRRSAPGAPGARGRGAACGSTPRATSRRGRSTRRPRWRAPTSRRRRSALARGGRPRPARASAGSRRRPPPRWPRRRRSSRRLGARGPDGRSPRTGERMLRFPVHPRLGRMLVEARAARRRRGGGRAAAILGERPVAPCPARRAAARRARRSAAARTCWSRWRRSARASGRGAGSDRPWRAPPVSSRARCTASIAPRRCEREDALLIALLAGFPDRVARRRRPHAPDLVLSGGGSAVLDPVSVVQEPMLPRGGRRRAAHRPPRPRGAGARGERRRGRVAPRPLPRAADRRGSPGTSPRTRSAWSGCPGSPDGAVSLEERRTPAEPSEAGRGGAGRGDAGRRTRPRGRHGPSTRSRALALARTLFPEHAARARRGRAGLGPGPRPEEPAPRSARRPRSELLGALAPEAARLLARELPERVALPGGRKVQVHYVSGQPPWIASRLQDFFGLARGRAGPRRVPLVLHLLAPNQRAVQVTQDLAGFWSSTTLPSGGSSDAATPGTPGRRTPSTPRPRAAAPIRARGPHARGLATVGAECYCPAPCTGIPDDPPRPPRLAQRRGRPHALRDSFAAALARAEPEHQALEPVVWNSADRFIDWFYSMCVRFLPRFQGKIVELSSEPWALRTAMALSPQLHTEATALLRAQPSTCWSPRTRCSPSCSPASAGRSRWALRWSPRCRTMASRPPATTRCFPSSAPTRSSSWRRARSSTTGRWASRRTGSTSPGSSPASRSSASAPGFAPRAGAPPRRVPGRGRCRAPAFAEFQLQRPTLLFLGGSGWTYKTGPVLEGVLADPAVRDAANVVVVAGVDRAFETRLRAHPRGACRSSASSHPRSSRR